MLTSLPHRLGADDLRTAAASPGFAPTTLQLVGAAALFAVVIGGAVGGLVTKLFDAGDGPLFTTAAGWAAFATMVALQAWYALKHAAAMAKGLPENLPEHVVVIDADGLRLVAPDGETFTRWRGIARADWHGDALILTGKNGIRFVVPARAMPDAAWREALRDLVAGALARTRTAG